MTLNPRVYREAAERIMMEPNAFGYKAGRRYFACQALADFGHETELVKFTKLFRPPNKAKNDFWFGFWDRQENQLARQLALLFMEQIAREEGKRKQRHKEAKWKHKQHNHK